MSNKAKILLEDLFNISTAVIYDPDAYETSCGVSTDSRKLNGGELFVALKGENFDGHAFVRKAVESGVNAVMINKNALNGFDDIDCTIIAVDDTTKAYGELACIYRKRLGVKVVSLTGSNGKTTTKEILYTILKQKFNVVKTEANNNNHIGVPLTIFSCDETTEVLVLEHGTNHFGEIEYTARIAAPDYALITNVGDSHLEYLINREGVWNEKSALLNESAKHDGIVFLNVDDPVISLKVNDFQNKITYALEHRADVKAEIMGHRPGNKPKLKIEYGDRTIYTGIPLSGNHNAYNVVSAVAVAFKLGLNDMEIEKGIAELKATKGRLDIQQLNEFTVIDDTYNANPTSVKAAIDVLNTLDAHSAKVLFLGDMFELGEKTEELHTLLAKHINNSSIDELYTVGNLTLLTNDNVTNENISKRHFVDFNTMESFLEDFNPNGKAILVKGSRGMKMERVIEKLKTGKV